MKKGKLYVGCSGWNYKHWKGLFYPENGSSGSWFCEYSKVFSTVEINNTFYKLPDKEVFESWRKQAPTGFIYAVKANRFITHMKKLKDPKRAVGKFLTHAEILKKHLGPVLFQLPPNWHVNIERFYKFTGSLSKGKRYVFEFRDPSWYSEEIYRILSKKNMSMCIHDMKGSRSPEILIGPLCYIRFHGTESKYGGKYSAYKINKWASFIANILKKGKDVYAYFNNDAEANAPHDAVKLIERIKKHVN